MNKIILFVALLLSVSCLTDNQLSEKANEIVQEEESEIIDKSFDVKFNINKLDNSKSSKETYNLAVTIELKDDSYVISPYSQDTVYGHFEVAIDETDKLSMDNELLEIPNSVEAFDSILNEPVKFVRTNTTYKQKITPLSEDDFNVSGFIWFVLEPSCVPYEVEFVISHSAGKMGVKKIKTINLLKN